MPATIDAHWLAQLRAAHADVMVATEQKIRADGALAFVQQFVAKQHGLGDADVVDMETGAITRAPQPEPAT